jgi:hypothetical protein
MIPNPDGVPAAISANVGAGREVDGTNKPSLMVGSPVNAMHPTRIVSDAVNAMHSARIVGRHIGHPGGSAVDHHGLGVVFLVIVGRGRIAVGYGSVAVRWV